MSLTVRQIIRAVYLLPPNFCVEEETGGRNADYLHSSKSKSPSERKRARSLVFILSLYLSLCETISAFVEKDGNLCSAVFGWNTTEPCGVRAK